MLLRSSSTCVPLFVPFLLVAACGSDDGGSATAPDAGLDPAALWADLEACGLTGTFRIENGPSDPSCAEWPLVGETVTVERVGDEVILRAGPLELAFTKQAAACSFAATGCQNAVTTDEFGTEHQRYFAPDLTLMSDPAGAHLAVSAVDVIDARVGGCDAGEFDLAAIAACDPFGTFVAAAPAAMTGTCDLDYPAGEVVIARADSALDGIVVTWAGDELDGLTLDQATCTISGDKGVTDFWSWNGAMRMKTLSVTVAGDQLTGTATEALDGATFEDETCAGASFALAAARPATRPATRLDATCAVPQPAACGNGVCEDGEGCRCADCTCTGDATCAPDDVCRAACEVASEAADCGATERCSPVGPFVYPTRIFENDPTFCIPAGGLGRDAVCASHDDCGRGLICHYGERTTVATCQPPCDGAFADDFADCPEPEVCSHAGDGSGSGTYPTAIAACELRAGLGEDCSATQCESGTTCLKSCINGACEWYCTEQCSGGGCPAEVPVCNAGLGVCMKE